AVRKAPPITLYVQSTDIKDVLAHCFKDLPLQYVIQGKNIIISRRTNKNFTESEIMEVQQRAIQGTVRNEKGEPLASVSILIKGTTTGTTTDKQGFYMITLPTEHDVLLFSSMGYATLEAKILDRTELSVMLKEQSSDLEEVVIVGYGTQKKSSVTGALSVLNMRDKENQPHTNVSQALHGVSGLWVNQAGGKPGQDVGAIKVRGVGTLNNSNPLVLVDGIEYNMNDVNPEFIESITVLKDASAAIYGSRAANGVILVTTKQGTKRKTKINYSFSQGLQKATALPDVEWDAIKYMELKNTALRNEGKTAVDYSDDLIEEYKKGMLYDPLAYPSVNWFDE